MEREIQLNQSASKRNQKLSPWVKLSWGSGGLANDLVNAISMLSLPVYSVALGVDPLWMGIAMAVPRLWDAISDPIMGNLSDNMRGRFGRRRPFILIGALLLAITFPALYAPSPLWSDAIKLGYFIVMSLAFYTAFTIWNVPWNALGFELSDDYDERTSVQAYRAAMATLAGWVVPWTYKLCFVFGNGDEVAGARWVGLLVGVLMMLSAIPAAIFCKERSRGQQQPKIRFWPAVRGTFGNRPYLFLCAGVMIFLGGILLVQPMTLYVNIYYVFGGDREAASSMMGAGGMVGAIMALISVPFINTASRRFGKRHTLLGGLSLITLGTLSQWYLYTPEVPWLQFIPMCIVPVGVAFIWILLPAMLADVCDAEELVSGLRREGMYGAVYAWTLKVGVTLALAGSGFLLSMAGVDPDLKEQATNTVTNMRLLFVFVPAIMCGIAGGLFWLYPLSEEVVRENQRLLEQQRAEKSQ